MPSLTLSPEKSPLRLKTLLLQWGMSQQYWKKCKEAGVLKVNGAPTSWDLLLSPGDTVTWKFLPETSAVEPEPAALDIVYEDDVLLAVNKPAGLVTHNSSPDPQPALSRRVAWYYQTHQIPAAIHPVSRLDRETSGLVLFAKNACIHHMLSQQKLRKEYWGLTTGHWDPPKGCLNGPIARAPGSIIRRQVDPSGAPAVTHYQVLETFGDYDLVQFTLETGRTHQIRVHCAHAGHPLAGDHLYGPPGPQSRHLLHAKTLELIHPLTRAPLRITAPLPADFLAYIQQGKFSPGMV